MEVFGFNETYLIEQELIFDKNSFRVSVLVKPYSRSHQDVSHGNQEQLYVYIQGYNRCLSLGGWAPQSIAIYNLLFIAAPRYS